MLLKPDAFFKKKAAIAPITVIKINSTNNKILIVAASNQKSSCKDDDYTYIGKKADFLLQNKVGQYYGKDVIKA